MKKHRIADHSLIHDRMHSKTIHEDMHNKNVHSNMHFGRISNNNNRFGVRRKSNNK